MSKLSKQEHLNETTVSICSCNSPIHACVTSRKTGQITPKMRGQMSRWFKSEWDGMSTWAPDKHLAAWTLVHKRMLEHWLSLAHTPFTGRPMRGGSSQRGCQCEAALRNRAEPPALAHHSVSGRCINTHTYTHIHSNTDLKVQRNFPVLHLYRSTLHQRSC